ncbi:hypothetical protein HHI36_001208, partial [Cryptolaemus montrouzieri]
RLEIAMKRGRIILYGSLLLMSCCQARAQEKKSNFPYDPYNQNNEYPLSSSSPNPNINPINLNPSPPNLNNNQFDNENPVQFPNANDPYDTGNNFGGRGQYDQFEKSDQFGRPDFTGTPATPWDNPNAFNFDTNRDQGNEIKEA